MFALSVFLILCKEIDAIHIFILVPWIVDVKSRKWSGRNPRRNSKMYRPIVGSKCTAVGQPPKGHRYVRLEYWRDLESIFFYIYNLYCINGSSRTMRQIQLKSINFIYKENEK
jgi:hypothetical protein